MIPREAVLVLFCLRTNRTGSGLQRGHSIDTIGKAKSKIVGSVYLFIRYLQVILVSCGFVAASAFLFRQFPPPSRPRSSQRVRILGPPHDLIHRIRTGSSTVTAICKAVPLGSSSLISMPLSSMYSRKGKASSPRVSTYSKVLGRRV